MSHPPVRCEMVSARLVLALALKGMLADQVVFVWQLQHNGEEAEQRQNDVGVERALECLDLR